MGKTKLSLCDVVQIWIKDLVASDATRIGKEFNMPIEYNAEADKDSLNDMKTFFVRIFKK